LQEKSQFYPKVSVVVPVKNGAPHIRELLDSLMHVNYDKDKLEIIVVDGNSTDSTKEIVSQYPVKILTEERPGLNAARNTGIKHSSGEIIAFTDFDCVVSKDWIRKTVENFQNPQVGCVGGNALGYYDHFLSHYSDESIIPVLRMFKKREVLDAVKPPQRYPAGCNMAIRREALKKVGIFDESVKYGFDEDELVERICKGEYKFVLDPDVLVQHKHRSTLRNLLKQNFSYGRGLGNLLKTKGTKSAFSKWALLCSGGFVVWSSIILSLMLYTLFTWSLASQAVLLTMFLSPPIALIIFYAYQTIKKRDKKYGRMIIYPIIDIARSLVFVLGITYQLLKS